MTLNGNAMTIVEEMKGGTEELRIGVSEHKNGATIIDCGVEVEGGIEAGRLFSMVCLGGLAQISVSEDEYGEHRLNTIHVETTEPRTACIASQKAGWRVKVGGFSALGSGPARLLAEKSKERHSEDSDVAVIALECSRLPDENVTDYLAERCGIEAAALAVLTARTASIAGSTQVSARMVETAIFKMDNLGFDVEVVYAAGTAPIAPVIGGDSRMMGVTNDMIIYGSQVYLKVKGDIDVESIPSISSSGYGIPFLEMFKKSGYDFYKIDQGIFAPAEVKVEVVGGGGIRVAGRVNPGMIKKTLEVE